MAKLIIITGEPASGKTSLILPLLKEKPDECLYFDADGKGLNFKGWRDLYGGDHQNYIRSSFPQVAVQTLNKLAKNTKYKYFIVDTVSNLMIADEMRRSKEKGYDKWMDLAQTIWDLVDLPSSMRDDLTVILLFHSQTERTEDGYEFTRIKTNGRKTEKNSLESKSNWVLRTVKHDDEYMVEVTSHNSTSRTPMGAFDTDYVKPEIMEILKVVEEY